MKKITVLFIITFVAAASVYMYQYFSRKKLEAKVTAAIEQTEAYRHVGKIADSIKALENKKKVEHTITFLNANTAVIGYKEVETTSDTKSYALNYKTKNFFLVVFDKNAVLKEIKPMWSDME